MLSGGQPDNQNAAKLKTDELKKIAYKQYCAHLAMGKSKKSWTLKHPDLRMTWETMEKYIKESELDFDPIEKKIAESDGFARWEQVVEDSADGKNKEANTATLQMLMRNKYSWDKTVHNVEDASEIAQSQEKLMKQLAEHQKLLSSQ